MMQAAKSHGSNSHYETDFGVSSAFGAGNTKISPPTAGFQKTDFYNENC